MKCGSRVLLRWLGLALLVVFAIVPPTKCEAQERSPAFSALYLDAGPFLRSIHATGQVKISRQRISGITVPHHLLAADLIAHAFRIAQGERYDKIIILFPDHFKKTRLPFATTVRDFQTVFGAVRTNQPDATRLLAHRGLVEASDLFEKDHGIGAILPYVRHFFPDVAIVPIAVALGSQRSQWDQLVSALGGIVTDKTLIIQSTDFSHYLPPYEAFQHDQEVLNILSAGDLDAVANLVQPKHLDSRGAQYVQMRLQREHFQSRPVVILNRNSQAYSDRPESETTSYVVQVYPAPEPKPVIRQYEDKSSKTYCFVGDTFFGRHMLDLVASTDRARRLLAEMKSVLNGCPLIVNLEGVLVEEMPSNLGKTMLAMPAELSIEWLKALNVVAVSVANNHVRDLGEAPFQEMIDMLAAAGIRVLRDGDVQDLGPFRVVALTDLNSTGERRTDLVSRDDIDRLAQASAAPPLFAFLHWGTEYEERPGARERELADGLRRSAVSLIVGAHPHRASQAIESLAGGQAQLVYSLGNFLFDQRSELVSGALLEVTLFDQGTFFTRLIPLPNFYKDALRVAP
jgi:AmmeMemoRadiSam system protein B